MTNSWQELIDYVQTHACNWAEDPSDLSADDDSKGWGIHLDDPPPHNQLLGPVFPRGAPCRVVRHKGRNLCSWGDINRPDMTFSVTKTYLAIVAGLAYDNGLITDLDAPVQNLIDQQKLRVTGFSDGHNKQITWRQLLQFTSEWQGSCFGIPDQVDHHRVITLQKKAAQGQLEDVKPKGTKRKLLTPGSYWEYNDIRINQFALVLMHLFKESLPDVFDREIMRPLGIKTRSGLSPDNHKPLTTNEWQWYGYENSWQEINSKRMQSVPGGGHWGGGMVICAEHQAIVAELLINRGQTKDGTGKQLLSPDWINLMLKPCEQAPFYGLFTWLNTDHCISPAAPESTYFAMGIGGQLVMHDPVNALIAVLRWTDANYTTDIIELIYRIFNADSNQSS